MTEIQTSETAEREAAALGHVAIHEKVEQILQNQSRGLLLDVPAGEGALAARLQKQGFEVACADLYPQIFRLKNTEVKRADLDARLPFDDASFDFVVCVEGLEHIENPANAIREFRRILKPSGQIVVSVPNILNIEERLKWLFFGYTSHFKPLSQTALDAVRRDYGGVEEVALHVNPIGYSELRYLLEKNGFLLRQTHLDKPKGKMWLYFPLIGLIRLAQIFTPEPKRRERWTNELNSDEILLGGNTLIIHAILK